MKIHHGADLKRPIRFSAALVATLFCSLLFPALAAAHVTVSPAETKTATFQTFSVNVPSEKSVPTTAITVILPAGLDYVTPSTKPGWTITTEKGADNKLSSITWSGGTIEAGFRDEFQFSAKTPASPTSLEWKAYQTHQDGSVVSWDQSTGDANKEGSDKGPFSVTTIGAHTALEASLDEAKTEAANAKAAVSTLRALAVAAIAVSLVSIFFATRPKR